jgi:phosphatidylethanolamine-binding protein (PEBP) family uncharacterized protein/Spy/CpxP family protein refolding chaperone
MWANLRTSDIAFSAAIFALGLFLLSCPCVSAEEPPGNRPPRRDKGAGREPDRGRRDGPQQYSIQQAISDQAQLHTIAFSGLAFITGDFGGDTFIPPGKVCDFFGFQYMRDIDAAGKGHNPKFLDRVAGNVLKTLTDEQRQTFETLARKEAEQLNVLARKRWPLIKAFCRQLNGEAPAGSQGLNQAAVVQYVGDIFAFDAELSCARAEAYGKVAAAMTADQKAYFGKMKFGDFNTWPEVDMEQYKLPRGTDKLINVAYMTYASEFFSWYAGSVEADTYFCPERHGTYFGGFYMKDMPAMGKKDYDISTSVTGDSGKTFLEILTAEQRRSVTTIPDLQRKALKEVVDVRRGISTELRKPLKGQPIDRDKVLALGRRYGELDGEMSYYYATAFARVNKALTAEQRQALVKLRNLDGYTSAPAYIYSSPVQEEIKLPDTDSFFFPPKKAAEGQAHSASPATEGAPPKEAEQAKTAAQTAGKTMVLRSSEVADGGQLPKEFTGDGAAATLPLEWTGAPAGAKSFALIMHHVAPDMTKWYWVLYNIPADTTSLPKNVKGVGTLGNNSVTQKTEYAPPRSKGPGPKTYIYTVYALSAPPKVTVPPAEVNRDVLLEAMKGLILASGELKVVYSRPEGATGEERPPEPR